MSWIRNHIRYYVVPGIFALARGETLDQSYPLRNLRPSSRYKRKEIGLIYTALRSSGTVITPVLDAALAGRGIFGTRASDKESIHSIVKNSLRTLRRVMKTKSKLILPGRDVWFWSVMAHKMGVAHVFDSRVSRQVARHAGVLQDIVAEWKLDTESVIFDTGFAGSIYDQIVSVSGIKCHNLMLSTRRSGEQLYPNHAGSRVKALAIEYLPKYQKTGTVVGDRPVQYLAELEEFIKAACLTVWFWHHRSPRWIGSKEHRCKVVGCSCRSCKLWKGGDILTSS